MEPIGRIVSAYDVDAALDRLAGIVREHVRITEIYRRMGLR